MTGRARHLAAAVTGLLLGALAIGPGLAPGFVLSYDMVFVPDPAFTPMTFGLTGTVPRHVPSDAFAVALGTVLPGDVAQKPILLAIFVLACTSAASVVPSKRLVPRLAAGVLYAWNPFVAERLLLGQWALLLGYAALPWALAAAARAGERGGGRRVVRALLPAAVGGFAALAVSGLAALIVALFAGRRAAGRVVAAAALLSLPWLVPGLLRPGGVPGDDSAVGLFAARADTPFGTLGSLLLLGGVWNGETVPDGYGAPLTAVLWLVAVVGALVAYGLWTRDEPWRAPVRGGLAAAAAAGFAVAALGAVAEPVLAGLIGLWPGFAVLRDGQQFVAPLAVVIAVGAGVAADRAAEARLPMVPIGLAVVPVLLLPTLAWGAAGELRAVQYPDDWARARQIIEGDPAEGDVLLLPWAQYRSYEWNRGRRVLDPLPRYLDRRVIVNDAVTVGRTTVAPEDPRAVRLAETLSSDDSSGSPGAATLRDAGVRYVVVDAEIDRFRPPGTERVLRGPHLAVYRVDGPVARVDERVPAAPAVAAWALTGAGVFWSIVCPGTSLSIPLLGSIRARSPRRDRRTSP
ncbi:hypothetical protein [Actinomadura algeriensis]|uniref:Uncharacterized protein n=1 Tax=Actinomadura algeriensis TaxID=1679523 RepID=A0ABR9JLB5_9ACTN|nr:hypothetical protein [Actinomadura algeriensis]MBE1531349.1 hypothetical protein [Actinomadura algeriensis]